MRQILLEMKNIQKSFGPNKVLKGIDLQVAKGEVVSIVGENGAGKSTLMNILFGMPAISNTGGYEGEITWEGHPVNIENPNQAIDMGIGMVHQEFMLIPGYTVTENIKLNREVLKHSFLGKWLSQLDVEQMKKETKKALSRIHLDNISEDMLVGNMSVGFRQFIEIAREIDKKNIKMIVFDEPTAVLTKQESKVLIDIVRELVASGISAIFISHKLEEVMSISDRIVVLRDGELVRTLTKDETNENDLARLMVGRNIDISSIEGRPLDDIETRKVIMKIKGLSVDMPGERARNISIDIHEGEILGFCGLANQGKLSVANGVAGVYPARGEVYFKGKILPLENPSAVLKKGIGFVSEDRRGIGLLLDESIRMNSCVLAMQIKNKYLKQFGLFTQVDMKKMNSDTNKMIDELKIKCLGPDQKVSDLSGGNQQKVCLARSVLFEPEMLFISEPTRGIDIGAKQIILNYLTVLNRKHNTTIVITSSELSELRAICDRIAVIYGGEIKAILRPDDSDEKFGMIMSGLEAQGA